MNTHQPAAVEHAHAAAAATAAPDTTLGAATHPGLGRPGEGTVRCAECHTKGHPLQVIPHSYCNHRTCMRNPCWIDHIETCPGIAAATGRPVRGAETAAPPAEPKPAAKTRPVETVQLAIPIQLSLTDLAEQEATR